MCAFADTKIDTVEPLCHDVTNASRAVFASIAKKQLHEQRSSQRQILIFVFLPSTDNYGQKKNLEKTTKSDYLYLLTFRRRLTG